MKTVERCKRLYTVISIDVVKGVKRPTYSVKNKNNISETCSMHGIYAKYI